MMNKLLWKMNLSLKKNFPRPSVQFMQQYFHDETLIGIEIGVHTGANAESIMDLLCMEKLFLIDPYKEYGEFKEGKIPEAKRIAHKRFEGWWNIEFIEKFSDEAIREVPQVDFIYIDGNHDYEYVKRDIQNYWVKLKEGGIFSGHDFDYKTMGVIKAVLELVNEKNLKLYVADKDWWVIKETKE